MKKFLSLALSLMFVFGAVACNRRTDDATIGTNTKSSNIDKNYYNTYTGIYDNSIGKDGPVEVIESVQESYRGKTYPGNRQYLADVKAAYENSRQKTREFIDGLKDNAKTDDADLKRMNEDLIAEGEKSINDIDAKIKKLDQITADDYNKSEDEFVKLVNDAVNSKETVTSKFGDMLRDMDKRLGIDRTNMKDNTTK